MVSICIIDEPLIRRGDKQTIKTDAAMHDFRRKILISEYIWELMVMKDQCSQLQYSITQICLNFLCLEISIFSLNGNWVDLWSTKC